MHEIVIKNIMVTCQLYIRIIILILTITMNYGESVLSLNIRVFTKFLYYENLEPYGIFK